MSPSGELSVLKKRSEFLAVSAHRQRWVSPAFILQYAPRGVADSSKRIGYTASKKMVGKAVDRNRAKRRMRALAAKILAPHAVSGMDYVLIARNDCLTRSFADMQADMEKGLRRLKLWSGA